MCSNKSIRILSFYLLMTLPIYLFGQISNNNDLKQKTEEWFKNNGGLSLLQISNTKKRISCFLLI